MTELMELEKLIPAALSQIRSSKVCLLNSVRKTSITQCILHHAGLTMQMKRKNFFSKKKCDAMNIFFMGLGFNSSEQKKYFRLYGEHLFEYSNYD